MGVKIEEVNGKIIVDGVGTTGLKEPEDVLYTGNSGTTARLLLGLLSGLPFYSVLNGDESLNNRPMSRVADPLKLMGAQIWGRENDNKLPMAIRGTKLSAIQYELPVASAQVKSALILAGLLAEGGDNFNWKNPISGSYRKAFLQQFGVQLQINENEINIKGGQTLQGTRCICTLATSLQLPFSLL